MLALLKKSHIYKWEGRDDLKKAKAKNFAKKTDNAVKKYAEAGYLCMMVAFRRSSNIQ